MITLNLLPDIKRQYIKARRNQARVISGAILVTIGSVAAVAIIAFYVYAVQGLYSASLSNGIKEKSTKLNAIKDLDKYATVQNQLKNISELHAKKIIATRLFDVMTQLNPVPPNNVRISTLDFDNTTSTISLQGTTDTYTGLETFRDTLKNAEVSYTPVGSNEAIKEPLFTPGSVLIVSQGFGKAADGGQNIVSFSFSMAYNPQTFARNVSAISVMVPQKDTTQSRQDTPGIFDASAQPQGGQR